MGVRDRDQRLRNEVEHPQRYEELTITSAGVPIVLSVWHGRSGGPVAVFLPGTMTHPLFYEEFCDGLAAQGITVVGVHAEGHGKSPRVGRLLRLESLVANALDAAAWARARFGRPPVVVGSSQGGVLAIIAATRDHQLAGVVAHNILDPALAESITVSAIPNLPESRLPSIRARPSGTGQAGAAATHPVQRLPRSVPGMPRALVRRAVPAGPAEAAQLPLAFLADLFTADMIAMRDGSISCPVVVVAARGDPLFSFDYTQTVFARVAAPAKELVVFDTEHHLLFNECLPLVLPRVAELITHLGAKQPTQLGTTG